MRNVLKVLLPCAASMALAGAANATMYDFALSGSYDAHFRIDSSPSVTGADINGFQVNGVYNRNANNTAFINYPDSGVPYADIIFYSSDNGNLGGLEIDDNYDTLSALLVTDGPVLYTGDTSAPTFKLGTFALTEFEGTGRYTLVISQVPGAVPEPATWALAILGFGAVGVALRRAKRNVTVRFA